MSLDCLLFRFGFERCFLNPFSTNRGKTFHWKAFCIHQKLSKHVLFLMFYCKEYSFLVNQDVPSFHGDDFNGQFTFDEMLFVNGCYGLYKLKC